MGHIRLGTLPATKRWRDVVATLEGGGNVAEVAVSATLAAEGGLKLAANDPLVLFSLSLLTEIPLAARGPEFVGDLRALGLDVPDAPSLIDLTSALSRAIDAKALALGERTDLGEIGQMAAIESVNRLVGAALPSLFGPTAEDVRHAVAGLASGKGFALLARCFFAQLTERTLNFYLSRALPDHIGPGARFDDSADQERFSHDLARHCWESAKIVEAFAGGWFGKTVYQEGGLTPEKTKGFSAYALQKIRSELKARRDAEE